MAGVTTAIVVFLLLAQAFPSIIKNKNQYYFAFGAVLAILLLDALAHVAPAAAFAAFVYFSSAILQIAALVFLFLATGGLSPKELAGEIGNVIEVIRRGETKKEVIVPLSDAAWQNGAPRAPRARSDEPQVFRIDDPDPSSAPAPTSSPPSGPLPLD